MPLPTMDWDAVHAMAMSMRDAPRTVAELTQITGQSERTIYRWMRAMGAAGYDIVRRKAQDGTIMFSVLSTPRKRPVN